ncbi:MAG: hypothetical protein KDK01_10745 [Rhodobacteraceae bacterium]|jgi:hypothetical protein|nr:hypothetical protein [Paracoccaceae bacterium]
MSGYEGLMWIGAVVTLAGVGGLMATAISAWRLRQSGLEDTAMRQALQRMVNRNLVALFSAVLGLMMVIIGIALR